MNYRTFVTFNIVGGFLWAVGVTLLGYFLGQVDFVEQNLEIAILLVVAISVTPIVLEIWKARKEKRSAALDVAHDLLDPGPRRPRRRSRPSRRPARLISGARREQVARLRLPSRRLRSALASHPARALGHLGRSLPGSQGCGRSLADWHAMRRDICALVVLIR